MNTIKRTQLGNSYWNNSGAYQKELDELNEKMPMIGAADTLNGELIRAANRLYYDYCNNGNMNACRIETREVETVYVNEDGDIEYDEEEERSWNPYYEKFFKLILDTLEEVQHEFDWKPFLKNMTELQNMVVEYEPGFSDKDMAVYDYMVDVVVWYVLNHEDKPLPEDYDKD